MINNTFNQGEEGWCSYDYHWSIVAKGKGIYVMTTWERAGGVDGSGFVWADEVRWSADTPESPVSVLPLLLNRRFVGQGPIDLREARVSVYLRGDQLQLDGAQCYFWVNKPGTRWHMSGSPLTVSEGEWASSPNEITIHNDESRWYRSWAKTPASLDEVLANAHSYGFSFVGFKQEPRGRLSMDEFKITVA